MLLLQDSGWYLVGTCEGFIHKCSSSNNQQVLETYRKHYYQVNAVAWSPFSPDLFLSCSSDWTIQLWHQNRFTPLLSFSSVKQPVYDVRWSPKQPAVFGAVNEDQLEIWDLNSSIVDPAATFPAAPGVRMTSLLFGTETDCVIVGDDVGQTTVYSLRNLNLHMGHGKQLEDLIPSAASRQP
ncbi:hypothetical protein LDENG_00265270 [Lucifuga dentata]|nr:hypothetical protein LDENG_00265270 [Lucifuga dentata]